MADSAVAVTAGSGTSIDTRTEGTNGNHRQVVVLGDPATNAGVAPVDATAGLKVNLGADNDVTVTGTVTANLSATDNAVLDSIDTNTTTIAGAVSGSEVQVDVVGSLPAGTNAIGKLAANSGVDIGDVDVTTLPSDTFVAEDGALGKGVLLQGDDGTDRKNINVDATTGDVQVDVTNTVTVDGSGVTQPVSGTVTANLSATDNAVLDNIDADTSAIQTAVELIDDAVYTDGSGTPSKGMLVMGTDGTNPQAIAVDASGNVQVDIVSGSSAGTEYTEGDVDATITGTAMLGEAGSNTLNPIQLDGSNNLKVSIEADSVGIGGGTQYTEDDAAAANPVGNMGMAVRADSLSAVTSTDGDNIAVRATNKGELYVKQTDAVPVTDNDGSLTVDGTVTANLSATDNAVLDNIDTDTSTIATNTTDIPNVIGTDGSAGPSKAISIAGTESGGTLQEVRTDSDGHLQVDVLSGGGSGTEYNEDEATPATISGTATLMERDDALSTVTPVEGDWIGFRGTAEGALWVQDFNSDAILADTANIDTNVGTIAGAVSGTEMQVDVVGSLPAGTNAIGKLAANSGVDIGDVDVTSLDGVAAEASALGNGILIQGDDGTDRKNINVDPTTGDVQVDVTNTVTVDGSGVTQPVSGTVTANLSATDNAVLDSIDADTSAIKTAVELIDDTIYTDGTGTISKIQVAGGCDAIGTPRSFTVNSTDGLLVHLGTNNTVTANLGATDNAVLDNIDSNTDFGAVTGGGTETGALRVTIANNSTGVLSVDDNGGSITVDGTVTANLSATDNTVLDNIDSNTDYGAVTGGGTETGALRVTIANNSTGVLSVDDNGSTLSIDDGGGAITVDGTVSATSAGDVAHDAADSGNPVKIGAKVETDMTSITAAADGDRTNVYAGSDGILLVRQDSPLGNVVSGNASNTDGASTSCIAAQGAGVKTYLTDVTLTNTSATDIYVEIKDGTTAKWTMPVPAGGGVTHSFRTPLAGTANTAWNFDASAATTTLYCSMSGFKSKV